mmetsp:Transcript_41228/g.96321  ORF Transcript_41228/g.96321 Transcript_41228/m.96321 type:complete len:205 (-) Transcript_41228:263-877(-)
MRLPPPPFKALGHRVAALRAATVRRVDVEQIARDMMRRVLCCGARELLSRAARQHRQPADDRAWRPEERLGAQQRARRLQVVELFLQVGVEHFHEREVATANKEDSAAEIRVRDGQRRRCLARAARSVSDWEHRADGARSEEHGPQEDEDGFPKADGEGTPVGQMTHSRLEDAHTRQGLTLSDDRWQLAPAVQAAFVPNASAVR